MRQNRRTVPHGCYHITARANHRERLLDREGTRDLFMTIVARAKLKFDFMLENFAILGNHIHFIIRVPQQGMISKIMQWILGVFAQKWNQIHGEWGHFWGDRFFSEVLETAEAYRKAFAYVDENPVEAGLAKAVGDWKFSAAWFYRHWKGFVLTLTPWAAEQWAPRGAVPFPEPPGA